MKEGASAKKKYIYKLCFFSLEEKKKKVVTVLKLIERGRGGEACGGRG